MSKKMLAAKLAASTRKAKKMTTKSTKLAASTHKAEKIISKAIPKSTSLTELAYQKDLLNPVDLELFWKKKYLVRIWPD
jgi:predicted metal-dependent RNase